MLQRIFIFTAALLLPLLLGVDHAQSQNDSSSLDIGQYYTQVSPYLASTVHVYNPNDESTQVRVVLRNDVGKKTYNEIHRLAGGDSLTLEVEELGLRGIYHGEVRSLEGVPISVRVESRESRAGRATAPGFAPIAALSAGYSAVRSEEIGGAYRFERMLIEPIDRGQWDAEIVVQNLTASVQRLRFRLCSREGCIENQGGGLAPNERRHFVLSQLVDVGGEYDVTVSSVGGGEIAVVANRFMRHSSGRAEFGSMALLHQKGDLSPDGPGGQSTIPYLGERLYLPMTLNRFLADGTANRLRSDATDTVWYLPFVAAPNLPYEAQREHIFGVGLPHQATDFTGRALDDWSYFSQMNWYNWRGMWGGDGKSLDFCAEDPHYNPMVWAARASRNRVASACSGRPLFIANEPVDYRKVNELYGNDGARSWTDEALATNIRLHAQWPGALYCCGYLERPESPYNKIEAEESDYPTLGNVERNYRERFDQALPIDGLHLHFYVEAWNVDVGRERIADAYVQHVNGRMRAWVEYAESVYGEGFPIIVSEYGILAPGVPNTAASRAAVRTGLCTVVSSMRTHLGDNLRQAFYFDVFWGGSKDLHPPMWLVGSDDGMYSLDQLNDVGQLFESIVAAWPDMPEGCGG